MNAETHETIIEVLSDEVMRLKRQRRNLEREFVGIVEERDETKKFLSEQIKTLHQKDERIKQLEHRLEYVKECDKEIVALCKEIQPDPRGLTITGKIAEAFNVLKSKIAALEKQSGNCNPCKFSKLHLKYRRLRDYIKTLPSPFCNNGKTVPACKHCGGRFQTEEALKTFDKKEKARK